MRNVLILNRYRLRSASFGDWLRPDQNLYLINCATRAVDRQPDAAALRARYRRIAEFSDYVDNPEVIQTARRWISDYDIDAVLALSEYDIIRAAHLRDEFNITGQGVSSAQAFRDKLEMKQHLSRAAVPIVPYAGLTSPDDLIRFGTEAGYPLIVKPRLGTGSEGIFQLDGEAEAVSIANAKDLPLADYLVERYTPHELLHCDGVFAAGRIVFSEVWSWNPTMLQARQAGGPTVAVTLDQADPRRAEVVALADDALRALPTPPATAFHIEFFDTGDAIVVNEVASRIGGGRIQPTLRRLHGVDLAELTVRYQAGSPPTSVVPRRTAKVGGFMMAYNREGVTGLAPAMCPLPAISHYESTLSSAPGKPIDVASSAYLVSGIATGDSAAETRKRLLEFYDWFIANIRPETDHLTTR